MNPVSLYEDVARTNEPFRSLQIRAIHDNGHECEWRNYGAKDITQYSVYGESSDGTFHCIADCSTYKLARETAAIFRVFSGYTLEIEEITGRPEKQGKRASLNPSPVETEVDEESQAAAFKKKYVKTCIFDVQNYEWSGGPDRWDDAETKRKTLCQYRVNFHDGSYIRVIMTNTQRNGLSRTKSIWETIFNIGGEGYKQHK